MAAGSIVVELLAKTGSFQTDIQRAERQSKNFGRSMKEVGATVGAALTGAAAASAALAVSWTKDMARAGAEIARLSELSGMSTERFQEIAYAANSVGIAQDKLADIYKDTQDKVGDFLQNGAGPLKDFFDNIAPQVGVTADEFRRLSGSEAMGLYFRSLEKANLSQAEMTFYMEAIANDSSLLIPLLRNNAQGMSSMADEARALGIVMNDDAVRGAQQFEKQLKTLDAQITAMQRSIASELLPDLNRLVEGLNTAPKSSWLGWFYTGWDEQSNPEMAIGRVLDQLEVAKTQRNNFVQWQQENPLFDWIYWADLKLLDAEIAKFEGKLAYLRQISMQNPIVIEPYVVPTVDLINPPKTGGKKKAGAAQTSPYDSYLKNLQEEIALLGKTTELERQLALIEAGRYGKLTEAQQKNLLAQATSLDLGRQEQEQMKARGEALDEFIGKLNAQDEAYRSFVDKATGRDRADDFLTQMGMLSAAKEELTPEQYEETYQQILDSFSETTDEMSTLADQATRNIQSQLGDSIYMALTGRYQDIGSAFADMLARMASEIIASNIGKLLLQQFGGLAGGGGAGGIFGSLVGSVVGSFFGVGSTSIGGVDSTVPGSYEEFMGFATGGYTGPGGKYDVAGVVHRGEYVVNADATKRLGRGFLDRLNGFADGGYVGSDKGPAGLGMGGMNLNIETRGVDIEVVEARQNEMRLIARQVVASDTPGLMQREIANPSSRASRQLARSTTADRRR